MRGRTKRKKIEINSSSSNLSEKSKKHKPAKHREIQLVEIVDIKIIDGNREPPDTAKLCKILIDGKQGWFITAAVIFNFYFGTTTIELQNAGILENCVQINLDHVETTTKKHATNVFSAQEFYKALLYIITDPDRLKKTKDKARAFIQIFFKRKSDASEDYAEESAEKIADKYMHTWSSNVTNGKADLTFDLKTFDIAAQVRTNPLLTAHGLFATPKPAARQSNAKINNIASATVNPMPMLHAKAAAASQLTEGSERKNKEVKNRDHTEISDISDSFPLANTLLLALHLASFNRAVPSSLPILPMSPAISFPASHAGRELASFSHLLQAPLLPAASLPPSREWKQINVEKLAKDTLQPSAIANVIPKVAAPESMAKATGAPKESIPVATAARSEPSAMPTMAALASESEAEGIPMIPLPLPSHWEEKANSDFSESCSLLAEHNLFTSVPAPKSPRFEASNNGMLDNEENNFDFPPIFPST